MTIREINQLIEESQSLKDVALSYSEIANQKLKKIRSSLERNRQFFEEIFQLFSITKIWASKKGISAVKPKNAISILITSNYRFYGNINTFLIEHFIKTTKDLQTDRIIIGTVGSEYFKRFPHFKDMQSLILKGDQPDSAELNNLVSIIKNYNHVYIFYSRLKSLLLQQPTFTDIAAISKLPDIFATKNIGFIFEPELPKILDFFDNQLLTLLLEEHFLESEVSRVASRFISMDQAENEAKKEVGELKKLRSYALRTIQNNQLLDYIAAVKLWR